MLKNACVLQESHTPFDQLTRRIRRQVNSAAAQMRRRTIIARQPGEQVDDWDCLVDQLAVNDSVRMTRFDCGAIGLSWTNQHYASS